MFQEKCILVLHTLHLANGFCSSEDKKLFIMPKKRAMAFHKEQVSRDLLEVCASTSKYVVCASMCHHCNHVSFLHFYFSHSLPEEFQRARASTERKGCGKKMCSFGLKRFNRFQGFMSYYEICQRVKLCKVV